MKDLSTYLQGYAAVLLAAISVVGLLAATTGPSAPAAPQAVVVDFDDARAVTSMNIPF